MYRGKRTGKKRRERKTGGKKRRKKKGKKKSGKRKGKREKRQEILRDKRREAVKATEENSQRASLKLPAGSREEMVCFFIQVVCSLLYFVLLSPGRQAGYVYRTTRGIFSSLKMSFALRPCTCNSYSPQRPRLPSAPECSRQRRSRQISAVRFYSFESFCLFSIFLLGPGEERGGGEKRRR